MKISTLTIGAALTGAAFLGSTPTQAAYTDWQNEYTGNEPGTLALYNFSEGAETTNSATATAGSYNLVTHHAAATGVSGKFGLGLDVPHGTASNPSHAQAGSSASLFPTGDDPSLTVELWAKFDDPTETLQQLIDKRYAEFGGYELVVWNDGTLKFRVGTGAGPIMIASAPIAALEAGKWHHIAGTWNAADDRLRVYIDGVLLGSSRYAGNSIVNSSYQLQIGNRLGSSYYHFGGEIDGVRISSVAYDFAPIPEPAAFALLGAGAALMFARRR